VAARSKTREIEYQRDLRAETFRPQMSDGLVSPVEIHCRESMRLKGSPPHETL
jgi:hypothetical protein